jgi:hypothetical protein
LGGERKGGFGRTKRGSGNSRQLTTYARASAEYHLRFEMKFFNREFIDRRGTERRQMVASQILLIGKESN